MTVRQHAHVVGGGTLDALGGSRHTAEDVAATDDYGHFGASGHNVPYLFGDVP